MSPRVGEQGGDLGLQLLRIAAFLRSPDMVGLLQATLGVAFADPRNVPMSDRLASPPRVFSSFRALAVAALLLMSLGLSACKGSPTLPGTNIPDTPEVRSVLETLERYRVALVRKDAAGVLALVDKSYLDTSGTDDPSDDLNQERLAPTLRNRLAQLESLRFAMDYVSVEIKGARARVRVWIDASFRFKPILAPDGTPREQPQFERLQDFNEFEFIRIGQQWKFVRGL